MEYKKALEMAIRIWFIPKHSDVIIIGFSWIIPIRIIRIQNSEYWVANILNPFSKNKSNKRKKLLRPTSTAGLASSQLCHMAACATVFAIQTSLSR